MWYGRLDCNHWVGCIHRIRAPDDQLVYGGQAFGGILLTAHARHVQAATAAVVTAAGAAPAAAAGADPLVAELMVADVEEPESPAAWASMLGALARLGPGLRTAVEEGVVAPRKVAARFEDDSLALLLQVVLAAPGVRSLDTL